MSDDAFMMMLNHRAAAHELLFPDAIKHHIIKGIHDILRSPDFKMPNLEVGEVLNIQIGIKLTPEKLP